MRFKRKSPSAETDGAKEKSGGWHEALLDIGMEILFMAIGAGVLAVFGFSLDFEKLDSDLLVLIGIAAIAIVGILVFLVYRLFKKKKPLDGGKPRGCRFADKVGKLK